MGCPATFSPPLSLMKPETCTPGNYLSPFSTLCLRIPKKKKSCAEAHRSLGYSHCGAPWLVRGALSSGRPSLWSHTETHLEPLPHKCVVRSVRADHQLFLLPKAIRVSSQASEPLLPHLEHVVSWAGLLRTEHEHQRYSLFTSLAGLLLSLPSEL